MTPGGSSLVAPFLGLAAQAAEGEGISALGRPHRFVPSCPGLWVSRIWQHFLQVGTTDSAKHVLGKRRTTARSGRFEKR